MRNDKIFEKAHRVFGPNSAKDPMFVSMTGMDDDEISDASEAKFDSREKGEQIRKDLGREAMSREAILAGPVAIDAPMAYEVTPLAPTANKLESEQQPEQDHTGQLMLPEVGSPDHERTLTNA